MAARVRARRRVRVGDRRPAVDLDRRGERGDPARRRRRRRQPRPLPRRARARGRRSIRTPTACSSARSTWGRPSRTRSSAAPGTSAPARRSRSRCPARRFPNGLTLERRKLRGEVSEGMILAEDEVDLGTDHDGIMLLDDALEPGTPLADVLPLVEQVLEVEPTGNRPDLLSVYGIAREVAALFDGELVALPHGRAVTRRRRAGRRARRGSRRLPALHRAPVPRRDDRRVAGVAEGAPARGGRPLDLERRRRDELRDARARQPVACLRLRDAERRRRDRSPRARR